MIILNEGQMAVVKDIVDFYYTPGEYFYTLNSKAGTGKTTCIQTAMKEIIASSGTPLSICLTAPTNKATKVLRSMAGEEGLKADCKTIYSLLGLVLNSNNEIRHAAKMADGAFADYDVVVVDEGSMVSAALWEHLHTHTIDNRMKVIIMGDSSQLPPVKETVSKVFTQDFRKGSLTKVMRQVEGNPILSLAQSIRDAQADPRKIVEYQTEVNPATDHGVYLLPVMDWTNTVRENFMSEEYRSDPNSFRCLSYTNARVSTLNRMIRSLLVGQTESPFVKGERVIVTRPVIDIITDDKIHTDEECQVLDVAEILHPRYQNTTTQFKVWELRLLSDGGTYVDAYVLHRDSFKDYTTTLDALGKAAQSNNSQWRNFWGFKDSFAELQSPHAMTVHRSQGSTYKNVFVDMRDIYKNKNKLERLQLEYVACSRASETLVLMK
jgi:exodeoxyribonuclease-5